MDSEQVSNERIPMRLWGKDHWSLLAYIESLCFVSVKTTGTGKVGTIDNRRMRCNDKTHPLLCINKYHGIPDKSYAQSWKSSWGTRLRGKKTLPEHDDWDCLDDLDHEGCVEIVSIINGYVRMTEKGCKLVAQIREFGAMGGTYPTFVPEGGVPITNLEIEVREVDAKGNCVSSGIIKVADDFKIQDYDLKDVLEHVTDSVDCFVN